MTATELEQEYLETIIREFDALLPLLRRAFWAEMVPNSDEERLFSRLELNVYNLKTLRKMLMSH